MAVRFRGKYCSAGTVTGDGICSCEIYDPELIQLLSTGEAEWYFDSVDGRLFVQILES